MDFYISNKRIDYTEAQLDRSIVSPEQIRLNLEEFKKSIYTDLFPERKVSWDYIPKTLIFAKDDHHATEIVNIVKEVFAENFEDNIVPEKLCTK